MSAMTLEVDYIPGEEELDELHESVLNMFIPVSPGPRYSPIASSGVESHRSSTSIEPLPSRPQSVVWSITSQQPVVRASHLPAHQATPSRSTTTPRRPLPRPPGPPNSLPVSTASPVPAIRHTSSQPGPSTSAIAEPFRSDSRLSERKSRVYQPSASQNSSNPAADVPGNDVAGPSGSEPPFETEIVPTSPSTEFPDSFGSFLPGYVRNPNEDPLNASALLEVTPQVPEDIINIYQDYAAPPRDIYRDSIASDLTSSQGHMAAVDTPTSGSSIAERWDAAPDVRTFISSDYPMLRPPSRHSDFRLPNLEEGAYVEDSAPPRPDWHSESNVSISVSSHYPRHRPISDSYYDTAENHDWAAAGPSNLSRRNTNVIREIAEFDHRPLELHAEDEEDYFDDVRRFINPALLSHLAVQLRDRVQRGTHVKGSIPYPRAFTGKDIVSTLHSIIQRRLSLDYGAVLEDRKAALVVARSLQSMLFFYEVEWGSRVLQDGVEDVYMFMDDQDGSSDSPIERAELPTGVVTILTKCYSASCEGPNCYAYGCPRKVTRQLPDRMDTPAGFMREEWSKKVPQQVLASMTENEINRQTIIHKLISKEEQYIQDLDIVEDVFIKPLRNADPPVMTPLILEEFMQEVFSNILDLRETNRRLLEVLYVRQREQHPVIQAVGDIFLDAATEFLGVYPKYVGNHPLAEKRMKEELEHNSEFRLFIEKCSRQLSARPGGPRLDLKHYLNRPAEHLQKYPVLLEAVYRETEESNPDGEYVQEAVAAIRNLQNVAQLRTFQSAMGKGSTGKWEWEDLVSPDMRAKFTGEESRRQSVIFELIKGEMAYVRDLENIETMYIRPLRNAEPPIIPPSRLNQFLVDVFHNYNELHAHHRRLMDNLHEIQREEHPRIRSITHAIYDAALNFREAYMEYIPNYPIAAYRIDDEMAINPLFKQFVNHTIRHPDAHRLDMKNFINRPIPRLLRYELLLKEILSKTPANHEDHAAIPPVIDHIKALGKETEPGVASSKQKVELWRYNSNLVFKSGEHVDMDLMNEERSLIHTGRLLRQPDSGLDRDELFVMLFDNYFVMTHPREKDGNTKYHVYRRPIPLDLLTLVNFTENPVQRSTSFIRSLWNNNSDRSADNASIASSSRNHEHGDARQVFPCTIHQNGRLGGPYTLYAESAAIRQEWKQKLEEALGLRKVVQESNKVFEIENLSVDTFLLPALTAGPNVSVWHDGTFFTGKVTCSVPFNTPDGRGLVAIGCAEGVWIGYRHDSRSLLRVLQLKMVTQCAILEDFGLFLVLADKILYAYHLEALVPTTPGSVHASHTPQKIHSKDVQFFSVGVLNGRTLIIYMKKKGNSESVFVAVEPVIGKINERPKANGGVKVQDRFKKKKTEWFRVYKEFSLPDAYDLIFLRARIAVLYAKGFMIMDLNDYNSVTIPQRDDPRFPYLSKRCDSSRPIGIFRFREDEFLLCYNEFGLYVDRRGHPSRTTGITEWEGTAERVALHSPYVLLFDTRFIEIRHVETGRLVQIIHGNDVRCVWDGRTLDGGAAIVAAEGTEEHMVQEPRVHAVMNVAETSLQPGGRPRGIMQHVFELFPTVPLYLPGSLSSPTTVPYFPISFSPPRSPPIRSHHI